MMHTTNYNISILTRLFCFMFGNLFDHVEYQTHEVVFDKNYKVNLNISKAATTELHLTGQVLWPASYLFCYFALKNKALFKDKNVMELGAGVGLVGLLVSQLGVKRMIMTDGEDDIVSLLEKNRILTKDTFVKGGNIKETVLSVKQLWWGVDGEIEKCLGPNNDCDIVIGADILANALGDPRVPLQCAKDVLMYNKTDRVKKQFVCAYRSRSELNREYIKDVAKELGFTLQIVPPSTFLPAEIPSTHMIDRDMLLCIFELCS